MTAVKVGVVPAIVKPAESRGAQRALCDSAGGGLFFSTTHRFIIN